MKHTFLLILLFILASCSVKKEESKTEDGLTVNKTEQTNISDNPFINKVFEEGQKYHFGNIKKCEFFFECDCCSGKLIFPSTNNYYLIRYCMGDITVTPGNYEYSNNVLTIKSDGRRISKEYDYESDPDASNPPYELKDSTITKYDINYKIDECNGIKLIDESSSNSVAIESDLEITNEIEILEQEGLLKLINNRL